MNNKNINVFIAIVVALVIGLGIFWLIGTGSTGPAGGLQPSIQVSDDGTLKPTISEFGMGISDELGQYLVDPNGITLYTTTKADCKDACLVIWPPYFAPGEVTGKGDLGSVFRDDIGKYQYTWKGDGLYYFQNDQGVGDTQGHEFGGVWFLVDL